MTGEHRSDPATLLGAVVSMLDGAGCATAIQCGHFPILADPIVRQLAPGVIEEVEGIRDASPFLLARARETVGRFPSLTWHLGLALANALPGRPLSLLTLVNDWSPDTRSWPEGAVAARKSFYGAFPSLGSFDESLREADVRGVERLSLSGHGALTSENWLRRHFEHRLKRMIKRRDARAERLLRTVSIDAIACVLLDDTECQVPLLEGGQANCAGEVAEMLVGLHERGFRSVVNLIPRVCRHYVDQGTRDGLVLFDLEGMVVVNVAMGSAGEATDEEVFAVGVQISSFRAVRGEDGVEVEQEDRGLR